MFRHIQSEGLQVVYNDSTTSVKKGTQMMCALDFTPAADIPNLLETLRSHLVQDLKPIYDYFKKTYVSGTPARGRRRAVPPRYPPKLW